MVENQQPSFAPTITVTVHVRVKWCDNATHLLSLPGQAHITQALACLFPDTTLHEQIIVVRDKKVCAYEEQLYDNDILVLLPLMLGG
ncbi:hypothetical protein [Desulfovibrio cuneatus]|uniref:hypothetical protein n=1 Tax=Desulfovibrio cuneatus TaxID=159728 RepID=UPI00048820E6|nr:hypothetical protein [Desulfovibrio cuneatus]